MAVDEVARKATAGAWGPTATAAGVVAAVAGFVQSVLYLLDTTVLPSSPPFQETAAGRAADLATFFAARAQRQHDVLWDVVLRDVLGPVSMVALVVLAHAFVRTRGRGSPAPQAWALVLAVGALFKALSDLVFLSQVDIWRQSGFLTEPPADMIAVGRASDQVTGIAGMLETASNVTVAAALVGVAVVMNRSLRLLARVVAAVLVLMTATGLADWSLANGVLSVLAGLVLVPALLVGAGRWVARAGTDRPVGQE